MNEYTATFIGMLIFVSVLMGICIFSIVMSIATRRKRRRVRVGKSVSRAKRNR